MMQNSATHTALFLYSELAGYTVACLNHASLSGIKIHVVHWPVNEEAPFVFNINPEIEHHSRNQLSTRQIDELVKSVSPDIILVSGWMDRGYLEIAGKYNSEIPVVLLLDNPWVGSLKQMMAGVWGRLKLKRAFTSCWVPGERQKRYSRHLGFSEDSIETGFYSADLDHFNALYARTIERRKAAFPKRFLYVGRYVDFKGITEMWSAFLDFRKENPDWELWCVGTGELFEQRVEADGIRHFGFLQPEEMEAVIAQSGVFIIPSRREPWGVVVHEFAAAGFPLICSTRVGAAEKFLREGVNGFLHKSESAEQIKLAMDKCAASTPAELIEMGERSHQLAQEISPQKWTETLKKLLTRKCTFDHSAK